MLIGHKKQWYFLKKKFELGQLSHAYIFKGPEGIGKKRFAIEFIKLINCKNEKEEKLVEEGKHPDILNVEVKEDKSEIEIIQIREVGIFLGLKPYYGDYKLVVIDEADKMNQQAQSCFLKTLEEPKGRTIFILLTSKPEMLLPTILSRCQTIRFFLVPTKEIKSHFLKSGVEGKKAEMLANIAENRPGRAIDSKEMEKENEEFKKILEVCNSELSLRFKYAKDIDDSSFKEIIAAIKKYFRHLLFLKIGITKFTEHGYLPAPSEKLKSYSFSKLKEIIRLAETIDFRLSTTNINAKLALEILLLEI